MADREFTAYGVATRRWSLLKSSIVAAVVALILALAGAGFLIGNARSLGSAQRYENDTVDPASNGIDTLLGDYLDQESGIRGYLLAGQAAFLRPYQMAARQIPQVQTRLQTLIGHDPKTEGPLSQVVQAHSAWMVDYATPQLNEVRAGHLAQAQATAESGMGEALFDVIRSRVAALQTIVRDERRANESRVNSRQDRLEALLVTTLVLVVLAIGLALFVAVRGVVRPLRRLATAAQRVAGGRLHAQVPVSGPKELRDLSADLTAMRYRLLEEINRARLAGEALRLDSPTVTALHDALTPRVDLHPELEAVGRLDPAEGVLAGDWYDLIRIGDALAVIVGDVSGHGPASAVMAVGLRAVIITRLQAGGDPGAALSVAARSIADGVPEQFATVFVALVEPSEGRLRYASAGHPAALLARDRGPSEELGPTGPFVSPVVASWTWGTEELRFRRGDRLLVYTDGVTEGRNATKEEYGLERLKEELAGAGSTRPADTLTQIADHVNRFVGASQSDDRTLVYCRHGAAVPVS